jgi:hypothetical protein
LKFEWQKNRAEISKARTLPTVFAPFEEHFRKCFREPWRIFENFSKNKRNLSDTFSKVTISVTGKVQRTERKVKKFGKLFEKFSKMFHGSENIFKNVRRKEQKRTIRSRKVRYTQIFISKSDGVLQKFRCYSKKLPKKLFFKVFKRQRNMKSKARMFACG